MNAKPLTWCLDWNNLKPKEKFLMGCPFVATEDKVYKDIVNQLKQRALDDLKAWDAYPKEVADLAKKISAVLQDEGVWPSAIFLPDDPADIPLGHYFDFTDKWDFMPISFKIIEKDLGIEMDMDFWESLSEITYAKAIETIIKKGRKKRI